MADTEVENVLREIRERVRAEAATHAPLTTRANAAREEGDGGDNFGAHVTGDASAALARMEANLATTERAWNRLPPLVSNRTGLVARLELWVKRKIKRAAHWFTWEQVNFNSSVYHALRDALAALADYERRLGETRAKAEAAAAEMSSLRQSQAESESRLVAHMTDTAARLAAIETRVASEVTALRAALDTGLNDLRDEHRAHADAATAERQAHIADLQRELRERAEHILDELRVSFRQLSLEAGEAAVTHDRARRHIEARLEAIEKEVMRTED